MYASIHRRLSAVAGAALATILIGGSAAAAPASAPAPAVTVAVAAPAVAQDRRVNIINRTGFTMMNFYASNSGRNNWEEDILGSDVLPSGRSLRINIDDGSGACIFDFKAVFDDGDEVIKYRINVCEITDFTFS